MVDRARDLLDCLLGEYRNENVRMVRRNMDNVCKYEICGLCPFEMLKNTKFKIGKCKFRYHNVKIGRDEKINKEEYEIDLLKLLIDIFEKIQNILHNYSFSSNLELSDMKSKINEKISNIKKMANEGNLRQSYEMMCSVETLYKQLEISEETYYTTNKSLNLPRCNDCGVFIIKVFGSAKYYDHVNGKLHKNILIMKNKLCELLNKYKIRNIFDLYPSDHQKHGPQDI